MNVKEITLRAIRRQALQRLYDEMWRGLKKPGEIRRAMTIVSPATAKWLVVQLDAPRSIADVHGILLSLVDVKVTSMFDGVPVGLPLSTYCGDLVVVLVDYFIPVPKPVDKRQAWLDSRPKRRYEFFMR